MSEEKPVYPNAQFMDEVDELGYDITMELLAFINVHRDIDLTKSRMRKWLTAYGDRQFERGVEVEKAFKNV